jgi:hypothetical protein
MEDAADFKILEAPMILLCKNRIFYLRWLNNFSCIGNPRVFPYSFVHELSSTINCCQLCILTNKVLFIHASVYIRPLVIRFWHRWPVNPAIMFFMYRRPTLCTLPIAVDFLKSLKIAVVFLGGGVLLGYSAYIISL